MDRRMHDGEQVQRQVGDDPFAVVFGDLGNAVARLDAGGPFGGGQRLCVLPKLKTGPPCQFATANRPQRRFIRASCNRSGKIRGNRRDAVGHAAMIAHRTMRGNLEDVDHVLAVVVRIADQPLADRIDDEVQPFQRDLPNQYGAIVGNLRHVARELALLNGQPDSRIKRRLNNTANKWRLLASQQSSGAKLIYHCLRRGKRRRRAVWSQHVVDLDASHLAVEDLAGVGSSRRRRSKFSMRAVTETFHIVTIFMATSAATSMLRRLPLTSLDDATTPSRTSRRRVADWLQDQLGQRHRVGQAGERERFGVHFTRDADRLAGE